VDGEQGVVFPAGPDGRRSTAALGRAVVADALRPVDPAGALAAGQETNWRAGYLVHFRRLVEAGLASREAAVRIAEAVRSGEAVECDIVQTPEPTAETLAAGVLLFDEQDRFLLVDPTYKPGWEFPGGVVEPGEAPARAGMREVAEETGIHLVDVPRLLVVDWEAPVPPGFGGLRLLFDGGRLDSGEAARLLLPGPELREWRFVSEAEAADLLPPVRYERLRWALRARERGAALYLEAGVPMG
jgi:8-oxo-dGTP pyrophosphatase MutT (NUDIX family)